ncbi:MAG: hypothetical protein QHC67_17600 [Sphingobium sp.]|uniref:hypothetical protein n=1 Tax=Sphingobium sp. TaxID=1912891 RepID=UPI0029BD98CA|nr:hypothetical protein [Sphingobium sp.]MDX3911602.1 hypothetical protein [Sphingobium sp.]
MRMPRWAARTFLHVEWTRASHLRQITRAELRAEGITPLMGGLWWRWPRPIPGVFRNPQAAFAWLWNLYHSLPGEGWEDDPAVIAIGVQRR